MTAMPAEWLEMSDLHQMNDARTDFLKAKKEGRRQADGRRSHVNGETKHQNPARDHHFTHASSYSFHRAAAYSSPRSPTSILAALLAFFAYFSLII
jgi:hypothetical protein